MLTLVVGYLILALLVITSVSFTLTSIRRARNEQAFNRSRLQLVERKIQQIIKAQAQQTQFEQAAWQGLRKFRIEKITDEGKDIKSFYLKPIDKLPLPTFKPGQYLTLSLKLPNKDKQVVRCYSISSSPNQSAYYRISIKRIKAGESGGEGLISNYLHDSVQPEEVVDAKMPSGHFYFDTHSPRPAILIAGGVGITPLYSMFSTIAQLEDPPETWLFYGVKDKSEEVFVDAMGEIASKHDNLHLVVCHSAQVADTQCDYSQRISVELFKRVLPSNNYQFYICGPAPMMQQITQELFEWGVPENHVHFEAFGPATIKSAKEVTSSSAVEAYIQYSIIFTQSDKKLHWDNSKGTLLEFFESENIPIDSSCRAGNCGSCAVDLNTGKVKYDTQPGAMLTNNQCLACIAKPDSNLIIDA